MRVKLHLLQLVCIAAGAQQALEPGKGVNFYSKEKEAALGAQIAKEIRRDVTVLDNEAVRDYVRRLGSLLVSHLPGDAPAFTFDVIANSGSPSQIHEPLAIPGGYVFVRAGLFLAARDEAEFAGMLAHAIAHVAERHATRMATRGQIVNLASIPLIFVGSWNVFVGSLNSSGDDTRIPVGFLKFARESELQADKLAMRIMTAAAYDPAALIRYVDHTQFDRTDNGRAFSAMPLRGERLTALHETIGALPSSSYSPEDGFTQVQDEVRRLLNRPPVQRRAPSLRRQTPEQP